MKEKIGDLGRYVLFRRYGCDILIRDQTMSDCFKKSRYFFACGFTIDWSSHLLLDYWQKSCGFSFFIFLTGCSFCVVIKLGVSNYHPLKDRAIVV